MVARPAGPEAFGLAAATGATVALRAGGGEENIPGGPTSVPGVCQAPPRPAPSGLQKPRCSPVCRGRRLSFAAREGTLFSQAPSGRTWPGVDTGLSINREASGWASASGPPRRTVSACALGAGESSSRKRSETLSPDLNAAKPLHLGVPSKGSTEVSLARYTVTLVSKTQKTEGKQTSRDVS